MAMLLIGFGFLMVLLREYGCSVITAIFLLLGLSLPLDFFKDALGDGAASHQSRIDRRGLGCPLLKRQGLGISCP